MLSIFNKLLLTTSNNLLISIDFLLKKYSYFNSRHFTFKNEEL